MLTTHTKIPTVKKQDWECLTLNDIISRVHSKYVWSIKYVSELGKINSQIMTEFKPLVSQDLQTLLEAWILFQFSETSKTPSF